LSHALTTRERETPVVLSFARAAAGLVLGWLFLSGVLMTARSWASATRPLAAGEVVAAAIGLAIVAWGARTVFTYGNASPGSSCRRALPIVATSLALVFWGLSLTSGAGSAAAVAFLWSILLAEEGWAFWRAAVADGKDGRSSFSTAGASRDDLVVQQFTRLLTTEQEIVRGSLAVTLERGSRVSAGHVAFCPPLAQRPHFEVQPASTTKATLKVSHVYPHGARIEVRLPQAAEVETTVRLQFVARAPRFAVESVVRPAD
jgi:hypothetical protein